jgi:hypothetical protein
MGGGEEVALTGASADSSGDTIQNSLCIRCTSECGQCPVK